MTDKELLTKAAAAAGYDYWQSGGYIILVEGAPRSWNPLRDDGDAFRLAMSLGIAVDPGDFDIEARHRDSDTCIYETVAPDTETTAAARRAIVRCAAQIGKELQDEPL